jgi:predicted negative regulator of RcsB-dependent stress response
LGVFASWNFYQYWQRNQATQAAALYEQVERVVGTADASRIDQVFKDMQQGFPSTVYAHQAGLLVARHYYTSGNADAAKAALTWVADKAPDAGYQAIARLRLAGMLIEAKSFDDALAQLNSAFPVNFEALVADRKGDLFLLQDNKTQAIVEYEKAYKLIDERTEYRRLVEVKLNSLGIDAQAQRITK